jgi:ATP-dependent DNA ligase
MSVSPSYSSASCCRAHVPAPPAPCPTKASQSPSRPLWVHEIKHDGFRVVARKEGERVWLYSRPGNDLTSALPADRLHPQNAESADQTTEDGCPVAERVAKTP